MLIRIPKAPKTAKKQTVQGRIVLAYGEVTGHAHAIEDTANADMLVDERTNTTFVHAETDVVLSHEEHDPVTLPAGDYEVRRQQEFSPEANQLVHD